MDPEVAVDLRAKILAALDASNDRQALALLRSLLAGQKHDPASLAPFLAEILAKSGEKSFFRRHFESVFDEGTLFPLLRRILEQPGLSASVRKVLLRMLSDCGIAEAEAYLFERLRATANPQELADLIEIAKPVPGFQDELTRLFLDPSRPREARVAALERLARGRTAEVEKVLSQALATEQDSAVLLAMACAGVGWGTPALKDALKGLFHDYSRESKDRREALDLLVASQDPGFEGLVSKAAASDPDPDVRAQAAVELLHLQPPVAGMFIQQIVPDSQAQALGLRRGDIILQYNGQPYASLNALADAVRQISSQDQVPLRVYRQGQVLDLYVRGGRIGITADYVTPR
jgi:hypothetical protein